MRAVTNNRDPRAGRRILLAVALTAAGVGGWLATRGDDDPAAPGRQTAGPRVGAPPTAGDRASAPLADTPRQRDGAADEPRTDQPPVDYVFGSVQLRAIDQQSRAPIRDFTWTAAGTVHQMPLQGAARGYEATIRVPLGLPATVRLSAPGYATTLAVDVSLQGTEHRAVVVPMVATLDDSPVTLRVRDDVGRPVAHLVVDATFQPLQSAEGNLWQTAWSRSSDADDGAHRLRALAPGRYRLRLRATAANGSPLLLLPATCEFTFAGDRRVERAVDLLPGGSIQIVATDAGADLVATLAGADGQPRRLRWFNAEPTSPAATANAEAAAAVGTLAGRGPWELVEPITAGDYELRVKSAADVHIRRVQVVAGHRTRVQLP